MDVARQPEHRPELLPGHLPIPTATRIFYAVSCITAGLLTAGLIGRFVAHAADFSLLMLPVIPAGPVWSGPVKRMPEETRILAMPRLARAGALHLIPAWQEAEAAVIALMQRPPEERQGAVT